MVPADMISRTGSSGFAGMSLLFMSKYPVMNLPVSDVILAAAGVCNIDGFIFDFIYHHKVVPVPMYDTWQFYFRAETLPIRFIGV